MAAASQQGNAWFAADGGLIIGHRGASADAPENTLAAFRLAREHGADGFEFDVQLSRDDVPIIIHDDTLDRTTSGSGLVSALTCADLQLLDAGSGAQIPRLAELFAEFGNQVLYNVEIKSPPGRAEYVVEQVLALIAAYGVERQTVISSFDTRVVLAAQNLIEAPLALALLQGSDPPTVPAWFAGQALHPHYSMVNSAYMQGQAQGKVVNVWTVDDPLEARRLLALGVHALITNRPRFLRDALQLSTAE